jgi:hypothetical protein
MVKVLFGLPLRQSTGMAASSLTMAGLDWPVPDVSTPQAAGKELWRLTYPPPQAGAAEPAGRQ